MSRNFCDIHGLSFVELLPYSLLPAVPVPFNTRSTSDCCSALDITCNGVSVAAVYVEIRLHY